MDFCTHIHFQNKEILTNLFFFQELEDLEAKVEEATNAAEKSGKINRKFLAEIRQDLLFTTATCLVGL